MSTMIKIGLGIFAVLLVALPLSVNPYITSIAITWLTYTLLAMGFVFSMRTGLPRIDIVAWWSIGGITTALLMSYGINFFLASLLAAIISVILGWMVFSVLIPRGVTIFFMICVVFSFAAPNLVKFLFRLPIFHGGHGQYLVANIGPLALVSNVELYYLGLFFLGLNLAAFYLLYNSKIGQAWNAINSSLRLAQSVGVNVVRDRVSNIIIGNFFISLAGSYLVSVSHSAPMFTSSLTAGGMIMMYAFVGGLYHSFSGPLLGAFLLTFIPEYFRIAREYEPIITSVIAILIIISMPAGILGWVERKVLPRLRRSRWDIFGSRAGVKASP